MDHDTTYKAIGLIRTMVHAYAKASNDELWMEPRGDGPNAFYCQTSSGLFLEEYYGMPNALWTPWGKLDIGGSGSGNWDETTAIVVKRLGGIPYRLARYDPDIGEIGAVWALSKVDDLPLPEAVARPREDFVKYEASNTAWSAIVDRLGH